MSVMEMSHRGKEFLSIIQKAESDLRRLLDISPEYSATTYFVSGRRFREDSDSPLRLLTLQTSLPSRWYVRAPPPHTHTQKSDTTFDELEQNPHAKCLHICANETIHGVEFKAGGCVQVLCDLRRCAEECR
ncbi:unnamed protein product [Brassica rapa subsp. narinosa]